MSEITVGDLVVVVRPKSCCGRVTEANGQIYQVAEMFLSDGWTCDCGAWHDKEWLARSTDQINGYEVYRLRRIPPLGELDETEHKEELPA